MRPTLTLVPDCGSQWKRSRMSVRRRGFAIQALINPKPASGDDLKFVGAPLGNRVVFPLRDGALRDPEGLGKSLGGLEVGDCGRLSHVGRSYSMLNPEVKDGKPNSRLRCLDMDFADDSMGARIRQLRDARRLTQGELGKIVGVTKGAVSQWEHGLVANIKLKTVLKLCAVFNTDLEYLVHGPVRRQKTG